MILRSKDVVDQLAPHYVTPAIIAAVTTAASIAAQQQQASAQRRRAANAAQAQKQGLAADASAPGGVASSLLGQVNDGNVTRIKDMIQGNTKPVAGAADASLPDAQPGAQPGQQPMAALPQGQSMGQMMQGMQSQSLQQAVPDYSQWMQQFGGKF